MKERRWIRIALVILILSALAWIVDVEDTWSILKGTDIRWLGIAFLVVQLQVFLSAYRWRQTALRLGTTLTLHRAVSEYYLATLANLTLPGGIGGDAARVYRNRDSRGWEPAILSVTLERLAGQIALVVVTIIGWLLWPVFLQQQAPASMQHVFVLIITLCLFALCLILILSRVSAPIRQFINSIGPAMRRVWFSDSQWWLQSMLSITIVASYIAVFASSGNSLSQPIPLIGLVTIVPVVLLSMALPLSIGGWGVRELAAATLLPIIGLSIEASIAASVVYGLVSMLSVIPGALLCLFAMPRALCVTGESSQRR